MKRCWTRRGIGCRAAGCHVWAIEDVKHTKDVPLIQKTASRYFHNHQELSQAIREAFSR